MASIFQVDAFTDRLFGGNPAAVVPLDSWVDDSVLQSVANENNLAETAFIVAVEGGYDLRWFTPACEVALCGHATLAAAHVLTTHLDYQSEQVDFFTRQSGTLTVTRASAGKLSMSFPSIPVSDSDDTDQVAVCLASTPGALLKGYYSKDEYDYLAVFDSPAQVAAIDPVWSEFKQLGSRGIIVTAGSGSGENESDFVSRYFAPNAGIDEDPVTGSAHCLLAPYWGSRLNKSELLAHQISTRKGVVECQLQGDRTVLTGQCVDYLQGQIKLS